MQIKALKKDFLSKELRWGDELAWQLGLDEWMFGWLLEPMPFAVGVVTLFHGIQMSRWDGDSAKEGVNKLSQMGGLN